MACIFWIVNLHLIKTAMTGLFFLINSIYIHVTYTSLQVFRPYTLRYCPGTKFCKQNQELHQLCCKFANVNQQGCYCVTISNATQILPNSPQDLCALGLHSNNSVLVTEFTLIKCQISQLNNQWLVTQYCDRKQTSQEVEKTIRILSLIIGTKYTHNAKVIIADNCINYKDQRTSHRNTCVSMLH